MDDTIKYDKLPDGYRLATKKDFYDFAGIPKFGMEFIMQSFQDDHYQLFTVKKSFEFDKISIWIESERAWIKGQKEKEKPALSDDNDLAGLEEIDMMF